MENDSKNRLDYTIPIGPLGFYRETNRVFQNEFSPCSQIRRGQLGEAAQAEGLRSGVQADAVLRLDRAGLRPVSQLRGNGRGGAVRLGTLSAPAAGRRGRRFAGRDHGRRRRAHAVPSLSRPDEADATFRRNKSENDF